MMKTCTSSRTSSCVLTRTAFPRADQDSAGRSSRKTGNGSVTTTNGSNDVPKKVAFVSPPPALSGLNADRPLPEDATTSNRSTAQPSHPKDPRGSISTAASGPRPDVGSSKNSTQIVEATSTRSATSPYSAKPAYGHSASIHQSLRSATYFSQKSIGPVLPPASWSEGAEEDLVTHLGLRERTRQEVLWEIVASEERYVAELLKMKDTFIVPLLPYTASPVVSPTMLEYDDMSRLDTDVAPHQLPDALRQCLKVIEDSILAGHLKLSEGLRKRYDEQYPLVRSLADVFIANSHIFRGYADYVLHLERALEQANDVILTNNSTRRPKNKGADEWLKVCTFLRKLENDAWDRGETGLAFSLSKPFHRLLQYPLLFQKLLFHTDPSTFEYERTLCMVAEVENIVRSIEDEKIETEERDKIVMRDILARIEGLDEVKQLAAPKPSRVLVEERILAPPVGTTKAVRGKTTFKRLSDVLVGAASGAKRTCGWSCSVTSYYVVNGLARLFFPWGVPMRQERILYLSFKASPSMQQLGLQRGHGICTNLSRSKIGLSATVSSLVKAWCPWQMWFAQESRSTPLFSLELCLCPMMICLMICSMMTRASRISPIVAQTRLPFRRPLLNNGRVLDSAGAL